MIRSSLPVLVLAALLPASSVAFAQPPPDLRPSRVAAEPAAREPGSPLDPFAYQAHQLADIERLEASGRSRIGGGVSLAILGGAALVVGGSLIYRGATSEPDNPIAAGFDGLDAGVDVMLGFVLAGLAAPATAGAIYLIASGKNRHNLARERRQLLIAPAASDGGLGAVVSGTF